MRRSGEFLAITALAGLGYVTERARDPFSRVAAMAMREPLLIPHLDILCPRATCYSPRPDWENGWRAWRCEGGAIPRGPGRRMEPARNGYLIAGTHAFALRAGMRVFVRTPAEVVAERLTGARLDAAAACAVIRGRLAPNLPEIARGAETAHLVIDGTAPRRAQLRHSRNAHARYLRSGGAESLLGAAALGS